MKIPNKIHFAGFDYSVTEVKRLDDGDSLGSTSEDHREIKLEKDIPKQTKEETLIHELLHIAYNHTSKILSMQQEENIIRIWSKNIYGILKENNLLK